MFRLFSSLSVSIESPNLEKIDFGEIFVHFEANFRLLISSKKISSGSFYTWYVEYKRATSWSYRCALFINFLSFEIVGKKIDFSEIFLKNFFLDFEYAKDVF